MTEVLLVFTKEDNSKLRITLNNYKDEFIRDLITTYAKQGWINPSIKVRKIPMNWLKKNWSWQGFITGVVVSILFNIWIYYLK